MLDLLDGVDILAHNAGIVRRADAADVSGQDWGDLMGIDFRNAMAPGGRLAR